MSSKPLALPKKHLVNSGLMGLNALTMGAFLSAPPTVPLVAAGYLGASTLLSFISGYTTTAAVGGADMRAYLPLRQSRVSLKQHVFQLSLSRF